MLEVGDRIDRFVIEAFLGEGGLARVYRVRHERLGSFFALKVLSFRGKRLTNRLLREGRIQARLRHPNVVTVIDVLEHDGRAGLLMEYVEGLSLEQKLNRGGAMPIDEALHLFSQILAGVSAAHDAGVLHRDLKPGNILLEPGSGGVVAKVTDFGIARLLSTEAQGGDTLQSDVIGTPGYMAPEQASDPTAVDVRADLFSLGALLYGMVTGAPPFKPGSLASMLSAVEDGDFTPVRERLPECPEKLAAAIERCLAPDPDDRHASCHALASELFGEESVEVASLHRATTPSLANLSAPTQPETPSAHGRTAVPMHTPGPAAAPAALSPAAPPPTALPPTVDAPAPAPSRAPWAVAAVAVVLLGGGALWWSGRGPSGAPEVIDPPGRVTASAGDPQEAPRGPGPAPEASIEIAEGSVADAGADPTAGSEDVVGVGAADGGAERAEPSAGAASSTAAVPDPPPAPEGRSASEVAVASAPTEDVSESAGAADEAGPSEAPVAEGAPADDAAAAAAAVPPSPEADGLAAGDALALAAPPAEAPAPPPPEAPPPEPDVTDVTGVWQGRLGGRPSTLRVVKQRGARVEATLEVLLGTSYRTFELRGTLKDGRLQLQGDAPDGWALDARLEGGALDGVLTPPGRRKGTPWRGMRQ